jgi:hypothetical protein
MLVDSCESLEEDRCTWGSVIITQVAERIVGDAKMVSDE